MPRFNPHSDALIVMRNPNLSHEQQSFTVPRRPVHICNTPEEFDQAKKAELEKYLHDNQHDGRIKTLVILKHRITHLYKEDILSYLHLNHETRERILKLLRACHFYSLRQAIERIRSDAAEERRIAFQNSANNYSRNAHILATLQKQPQPPVPMPAAIPAAIPAPMPAAMPAPIPAAMPAAISLPLPTVPSIPAAIPVSRSRFDILDNIMTAEEKAAAIRVESNDQDLHTQVMRLLMPYLNENRASARHSPDGKINFRRGFRFFIGMQSENRAANYHTAVQLQLRAARGEDLKTLFSKENVAAIRKQFPHSLGINSKTLNKALHEARQLISRHESSYSPKR